jgi:hypothetical protein
VVFRLGRRKAGTLNRNKWIGFLFIILMAVSLMFCFQPPNSAALGDIILQKIGLKAWENANGGLHYTVVIYAFPAFLIGLIGATYFLSEAYPRFIKKLPLISVIFLILLPSIYTFSNRAIMTLSDGINALEYNREKSSSTASINSDGDFIIKSDLPIKNYSNKDVTFYIRLVPYQMYSESIINEDIITATDPDTGKPQAFTLHPKETQLLQVTFQATPKAGITNFQGWSQPVNIIIYTDNEERKFIKSFP